MTEVTLSRLQAHSRQQKVLGEGLEEERKQRGVLGSSSSSAVQVGDCDGNTQGRQIWGGIQQIHTPATFLLPGLPHCTAGWLGLGHPELSSTVGRSCQQAGIRNTSVGTREKGVLWATPLFSLFSGSLARLTLSSPLLPKPWAGVGLDLASTRWCRDLQRHILWGFPCDFSDSLARRQSCNAARQQS